MGRLNYQISDDSFIPSNLPEDNQGDYVGEFVRERSTALPLVDENGKIIPQVHLRGDYLVSKYGTDDGNRLNGYNNLSKFISQVPDLQIAYRKPYQDPYNDSYYQKLGFEKRKIGDKIYYTGPRQKILVNVNTIAHSGISKLPYLSNVGPVISYIPIFTSLVNTVIQNVKHTMGTKKSRIVIANIQSAQRRFVDTVNQGMATQVVSGNSNTDKLLNDAKNLADKLRDLGSAMESMRTNLETMGSMLDGLNKLGDLKMLEVHSRSINLPTIVNDGDDESIDSKHRKTNPARVKQAEDCFDDPLDRKYIYDNDDGQKGDFEQHLGWILNFIDDAENVEQTLKANKGRILATAIQLDFHKVKNSGLGNQRLRIYREARQKKEQELEEQKQSLLRAQKRKEQEDAEIQQNLLTAQRKKEQDDELTQRRQEAEERSRKAQEAIDARDRKQAESEKLEHEKMVRQFAEKRELFEQFKSHANRLNDQSKSTVNYDRIAEEFKELANQVQKSNLSDDMKIQLLALINGYSTDNIARRNAVQNPPIRTNLNPNLSGALKSPADWRRHNEWLHNNGYAHLGLVRQVGDPKFNGIKGNYKFIYEGRVPYDSNNKTYAIEDDGRNRFRKWNDMIDSYERYFHAPVNEKGFKTGKIEYIRAKINYENYFKSGNLPGPVIGGAEKMINGFFIASIIVAVIVAMIVYQVMIRFVEYPSWLQNMVAICTGVAVACFVYSFNEFTVNKI